MAPNIERMHQLVDETAEFYRKNPRAAAPDENMHFYWDEDTGRKCAIGRLLTEEELIAFHENEGEGINDIVNARLDDELPKSFEGLTVGFLEELQLFHDNPDHWVNDDAIQFKVKKMHEWIDNNYGV